MSTPTRVLHVWDPLVRIGHWLLVGAFAVAFVTQGEPEVVHTWAGYLIAAYLIVRVTWGFAGPPNARFASFVTSPVHAARYFADLLRGRAPRYLGHSPAGGVMVVLLLASLAATTTVGMVLYAVHDGAGPLATIVGSDTPAISASSRARSMFLLLWLAMVFSEVRRATSELYPHRSLLSRVF